jgi:hypothetical protein
MAKNLPPVLGPLKTKTLEREQKSPLPPIGQETSPDKSGASNQTSPSGDDSSPLSGSLALARRRNRAAQLSAAEPSSDKAPLTYGLLDPDSDGSPSTAFPLLISNERSPGHLLPLQHPNK